MRVFWRKKITKYFGKPKDLWKALKFLRLPNRISSGEVSPLKINHAVEHSVNSVLEGFKNNYSALVKNLVKMLPKAPNKYSLTQPLNTINTWFKVLILIFGFYF